MKILIAFCLIAFYFFQIQTASVPVNDINTNIMEDQSDDDIEDDDDFTTRGLERLSSAATCLVAGVEYTHGQQIFRKDPCEFCLCLDGEMFCWWQDCPPTADGPCRDRGPFSPCDVTASAEIKKPRKKETTTELALDNNSTESTTDEGETTSSETPSSTTLMPKFCVVMGKNYKIGDKLPHSTGNCVECICGQGAKVTCSPHQCVPADVDDDIADYRPPGPRQQNSEVF